jgi:hypothetical protein
MCFSAQASFIAAGTLTAIGLLSTRTAIHNKKLLPLATTPLFFALQQAAEGFVWITLHNNTMPNYLHATSMYSFVFFAGIWWPTWVPLTMLCLETNPARRRLLFSTLFFGATTSLLYLISMIIQPVTVAIVGHHLYYPTLSYPFGSGNTILQYIDNTIPELYLIATVLPFFLSSIRYMWTIGLIMGLACLTSQLFYHPTTASVWCFFAAIASMLIHGIVKTQKKD